MNNYWLQKRHLVWRVPFSLICGCKGRGGSFGVSVTRRLTLLSHIGIFYIVFCVALF